jgi:hypothetical protein
MCRFTSGWPEIILVRIVHSRTGRVNSNTRPVTAESAESAQQRLFRNNSNEATRQAPESFNVGAIGALDVSPSAVQPELTS